MSHARHLNARMEVCTAEDFLQGTVFYPELRGQMQDIAWAYNRSLAQVVGAFAILSPNNSLEGTLRSLVTCLVALEQGIPPEGTPVTTLNRNRDKAFRILRGEVDFSDIVQGEKVTAFRDNILLPDTSTKVTIDGHMINLMSGRKRTMTDALFHMKKTGGYQKYEKSFCRWARGTGSSLSVPALQAILWTSWRRQIGGAHSAPFHRRPVSEIRPYEMPTREGV
jgi:hypothetical protein